MTHYTSVKKSADAAYKDNSYVMASLMRNMSCTYAFPAVCKPT
jgi:hypothetical protein